VHAGAGVPRGVERQLERRADGSADVVGERHLGARRKVAADDAEALVGVDAPAPGQCDRLGALEREAGGVGEQVPHRRSRWAGRLVQIDDALLGRDQDGERGDRLRNGRQPNGMRRVAVRGGDGPAVDDARGSEAGAPLVDLAEDVHPERRILDRRPVDPAPRRASATAAWAAARRRHREEPTAAT
jgi:hypothetical protein